MRALRSRAAAALFALAAAACTELASGPIGPGGRANALSVKRSGRDLELDGVRAAAIRRSPTSSIATFSMSARFELEPGSSVVLDIDVDLSRLDEGWFPKDLDIAYETELSTGPDGQVEWSQEPLDPSPSAVRALRWWVDCLGCPLGAGRQRFYGRFRLLFLDDTRAEAFVDVDVAGTTPGVPPEANLWEVIAYYDVALSNRLEDPPPE